MRRRLTAYEPATASTKSRTRIVRAVLAVAEVLAVDSPVEIVDAVVDAVDSVVDAAIGAISVVGVVVDAAVLEVVGATKFL